MEMSIVAREMAASSELEPLALELVGATVSPEHDVRLVDMMIRRSDLKRMLRSYLKGFNATPLSAVLPSLAGERTHNPDAFISAMTRLANQNLADADPERWVEILLSGHHAQIDAWRREEAKDRTRKKRPDLLGEKDSCHLNAICRTFPLHSQRL